MSEELTKFLVELAQCGFLLGSSAELNYVGERGTKAKLSIFVAGDRFKVVCTAEGGYREHMSTKTLTYDEIKRILPPWMSKEVKVGK